MEGKDILNEYMKNVCGCGLPEDCVMILYNTLKYKKERFENKDYKFHDIYENPYELFFNYFIDETLQLTEHGSSIGGSWLTPKGNILLDYLEKNKDNLKDDSFIWGEEL